MSDKRRSPRFQVHDVKGALHLSSEATILNLSVAGMAAEANVPMKVGRVYTLTLRRGHDRTIRLTGRVVWCHLRGTRRGPSGEPAPVYDAGFSFEERLDETDKELFHLLEETAIIDVDKRVSGRFKVGITEPVSLDTSFGFVVRTISLSGCLIETAASVSLDSIIDMDIHLDGVAIRTGGRVAYAKPVSGAEKLPDSQLGIEFVDMPPESRAVVEAFIGRQLQRPDTGEAR